MFMNTCEYLDLQILRLREVNSEYGNVQALGFLLMPEAIATAEDNGRYPIAVNMISMFKELQTASWRRRLESERPGFKVPVHAQREGNWYPLFTGTKAGSHMLTERGIQGSSLPVSNLYVVPTPQGKRNLATGLLAEQLFAAAYLRIEEGHGVWVNRLIAGGAGPAANIGVEDPCFAGFNMFTMKSGRMVTLKNWFCTSLVRTLEGDDGTGGLLGDSTANAVIPANVKEVFYRAQMPDRDEEHAGVDIKGTTALKMLTDREKDATGNMRAFSEFAGALDGLLKSVEDSVPGYEAIPAKELLLTLTCRGYSAWNGEVNLELAKKGYEAFLSEVSAEGGNVEQYRAKISDAMRRALKLVRERLDSRVVKSGPFGLGCEDEVFREVAGAFHAKFKTLLKAYIFACRCAKTPFADSVAFARELQDIRDICASLRTEMKNRAAGLSGTKNPFLAEGKLLATFGELPPTHKTKLDFDPLKTVMAYAYRKCVNDQKQNAKALAGMSGMGDTCRLLQDHTLNADAVLEIAEENFANSYIEIADALPAAANPLAGATLANFRDVNASTGCKTHSPEFALKDSRAYHYHFAVKQGGVPTAFQMSNSDVAEKLGLPTMPNTANGADPFLATDHSGTEDSNFWKDEQTATSPVFGGMKNAGAPIHAQGLWIGTLGIDFTMRDVLERLYARTNNIKLAWINASLQMKNPLTTMTLVETVKFGAIMEAIESKLNEKWATYKAQPQNVGASVLLDQSKVRISVNKDGKNWELPAERLAEMGCKDDGDGGCQFYRLKAEWVGKILGWIRGMDGNGFGSFFPTATFRSVEACDANVFDSGRLRIEPSEIQQIEALKNGLKNALSIHGL